MNIFLLLVSGHGYTFVRIEVIADPVPVQVPTLVVLIEVREVPIAIVVHHDCMKSHLCHHPSNTLRIVSYPESRSYRFTELIP